MENVWKTCGSFNPLPSPKQGETQAEQFLMELLRVSIRSPHRSKGRHAEPIKLGDSDECFNPLPSPKQGETQPHRAGRPRRTSFNPLPSPKQGETQPASRAWRTINTFQSAPLTEARGDRATFLSGRRWKKFQSAPLTEARGDGRRASKRRGGTCFNPLPSPKQGETPRRCARYAT